MRKDVIVSEPSHEDGCIYLKNRSTNRRSSSSEESETMRKSRTLTDVGS